MLSLTVNPKGNSYDGRDNYASGVWKPAYISSNTADRIYAEAGRSSGPNYGMSRGFIIFDTSSIPADAIITSATLRLWCYNSSNPLGDGAVYICKYNSTNNYTLSAYGYLTNGSITTSAYNSFSLDPSAIVKAGDTGLATIEYHDYVNAAPGSDAINTYQFDSNDHSNKPELIVTYEFPDGFVFISG